MHWIRSRFPHFVSRVRCIGVEQFDRKQKYVPQLHRAQRLARLHGLAAACVTQAKRRRA